MSTNKNLIKMQYKIIKKIVKFIPFFMLGLMIYLCFNESVWADEMFDFRMIQNDYSYFLMTSRDAAPPLHFVILKFGVDLCGAIFPNLSKIIVAKIISVIPYIILVVFSCTKIKHLFGKLSSVYFAFTITTMPLMLETAIEVRQYSWAILFTTVCFVYSYEAVVSGTVGSIIKSIVFGVMAIATHYYSAFAIAFCYLVFLYFFFKNKNFEKLKKILFIIIGVCVLFSPWIIMTGREIIAIAESFWIPAITWNDVPEFLMYALTINTNIERDKHVIVVVFYIIMAYLLYAVIKSDMEQMKKCFIVVGILMPVFVLGVGVIIGLFIWPVFQIRYILPVLGCLWLGFSVAFANVVKNKRVCLKILVFLLIVGTANTKHIVDDEVIFNRNIKKMQSFFAILEQDDMLLVNNKRYANVFELYTDNEVLLWDEGTKEDVELIKEWLDEGREVYYFDGAKEQEVVDINLVNKCANAGFAVYNHGVYGVEYVGSILYQIYDPLTQEYNKYIE